MTAIGPIITIDDTVTVEGLPGRWVVDTIHLGNAERYASSRNHSFVHVSQAQGHGRCISTQVVTISDPRRLRFVRPGNTDTDSLNRVLITAGEEPVAPTPCDNIIVDGRIRNVHEYRADVTTWHN